MIHTWRKFAEINARVKPPSYYRQKVRGGCELDALDSQHDEQRWVSRCGAGVKECVVAVDE